MDKSVYVSEAEFLKSVNVMDSYTDFLIRKMEEYFQILSSIQENGICDNLACANISDLSDEVSKLLPLLKKTQISLSNYVTCGMNCFSEADNFKYPYNIIDKISSIINLFH